LYELKRGLEQNSCAGERHDPRVTDGPLIHRSHVLGFPETGTMPGTRATPPLPPIAEYAKNGNGSSEVAVWNLFCRKTGRQDCVTIPELDRLARVKL
jgi:hypothetical protein